MSNIVMFLYRGHSTSMSLRKGEGIDKKSDKKLHRREDVQPKKVMSLTHFYVLFSVTQSFLLGLKLNNITATNKKSTSKSLSVYLS